MLFDVLIVDPNPNSRSYLWQATLAQANFRSVKAVAELNEALEQLNSGIHYDVLLITSALSSVNINQFVPAAKKTEAGKEAAYVVVLQRRHQNSENVATGIVDGTDGFLLEPFSVHSMKQVAAIAARVRGEHEAARMKTAISIMLEESMEALNVYAECIRKQSDAAAALKDFKRASKGLRKIAKDNFNVYVDLAAESFAHSLPRPPKQRYSGVSNRVRELEQKDFKS